MTTTLTHLLYVPAFDCWVPATKTPDGWRFSNGHLAALWLLR